MGQLTFDTSVAVRCVHAGAVWSIASWWYKAPIRSSTVEGGKRTFFDSRGEVCGEQAVGMISTFFLERERAGGRGLD